MEITEENVDLTHARHLLNHGSKCPACNAAKAIALRNHKMSAMGLVEAGEQWLVSKRWKRRKPKTMECCQGYLKNLIAFFGDIKLKEIHAGSLLAYEQERAKTVGASAIRHELSALSQILRMAGLWDALKDFYSPMPDKETELPKVYTLEEQERIFDFAADDPNLELARIVYTISRHTSATGTELRLARIRQLDLTSNPRTFRVTADTTKNKIRPRVIPLVEGAEVAFRDALYRAAKLGAHRPEHFLFPYRVNRSLYDPNRPASKCWLRKQTGKLRERTGIEHLQPHSWRHQLATELIEEGVPDQTIISICGWVSRKMFETYGHIRMQAKLDAFNTLDRIKKHSDSTEKNSKVIQFPG